MAGIADPANIVVARLHDGSGAIPNFPNSFLDPYTTAGVASGSSVAIPTSTGGGQNRCNLAGGLNLNTDGTKIVWSGCDQAPSDTQTFFGSTNKVWGTVDQSSVIDTSTKALVEGSTGVNDGYDCYAPGPNAIDGSKIYWSAFGDSRDGGGNIFYIPVGGTSIVAVGGMTQCAGLQIVSSVLWTFDSSYNGKNTDTNANYFTPGEPTTSATQTAITQAPGGSVGGSFQYSPTVFYTLDGTNINKWTITAGAAVLGYSASDAAYGPMYARSDGAGGVDLFYLNVGQFGRGGFASGVGTLVYKRNDSGSAFGSRSTIVTAAANTGFAGITGGMQSLGGGGGGTHKSSSGSLGVF